MICPKCGSEISATAKYCPGCGKNLSQAKRKPLKRANGTGTVYKLSGRRRRPWVAAKNKIIIGYYETKSEALGALERLNGKALTERYNLTFAEVYENWSREHYPEIANSGINSYKRAFKIFSSLHNRKFRELRTADFQAVIDSYAARGYSYSALSKLKQLLTQMSKWAIREELITTNFASFVRLPKEEKTEKQTFSEADIEALRKDDSEPAKIVLMLIYTGMRIGELFSLRVADYHGTFVVGGEKTKAGRNRIIPIRPDGRKYFAYFAERATGSLLLSGYSGQKAISKFRSRDYYPLLERLGIERKSPHATRHTYASWAVSAGVKPETLQKILGHKKYSTTAEIYVHQSEAELVAAIEKADSNK